MKSDSPCAVHTHSNAHGAESVYEYIYKEERKNRSLCGGGDDGGKERNVKAARGIEPLGNDRASRRRSAAIPSLLHCLHRRVATSTAAARAE